MGNYIALTCIGVLVVVGLVVLDRRRRSRRYDLQKLYGSPLEDPDHEGMVDQSSGPYCYRCDHPNPPGTFICRSCGQKLG